jgi:uncharacterized membrane protein YfcA
MNLNNKKKQPNKWLALINIPLQMGIVIFVFAFLGNWLNEKYPLHKADYKIIFVLIGVFLALYNVIRQVNQINKNE